MLNSVFTRSPRSCSPALLSSWVGPAHTGAWVFPLQGQDFMLHLVDICEVSVSSFPQPAKICPHCSTLILLKIYLKQKFLSHHFLFPERTVSTDRCWNTTARSACCSWLFFANILPRIVILRGTSFTKWRREKKTEVLNLGETSIHFG